MLESAMDWWNALEQPMQAGVVAVAGGTTLIGFFATRGILGKIMARKRERQQRAFREQLRQLIEDGDFGRAIEDKLVCEIQKKVAGGQLSLDEARMIYSHYSRLGLWGLHPRKFNPPKTGLDLTELKERLMKAAAERDPKRWGNRWRAYIGHTVHTEQGSTTVVSMLEGVKL